jgi:hypothetical protein
VAALSIVISPFPVTIAPLASLLAEWLFQRAVLAPGPAGTTARNSASSYKGGTLNTGTLNRTNARHKRLAKPNSHDDYGGMNRLLEKIKQTAV